MSAVRRTANRARPGTAVMLALALMVGLGVTTVVAAPPAAANATGGTDGATPTDGNSSGNTSGSTGGVGIDCEPGDNGAANKDGSIQYAYIPACDRRITPRVRDGRYLRAQSCIIGVHVWRFYGMNEAGKRGLSVSLSEVPMREMCPGRDDPDSAASVPEQRVIAYWPHPADGGYSVGENPQRVWKVRNISDSPVQQDQSNTSFYEEALVGAHTCYQDPTADDDVNLVEDNCALTTATPLVRTGKTIPGTSSRYTCQNLRAPVSNRLSSWLAGQYGANNLAMGLPEATYGEKMAWKAYAQKVIARHYFEMRNLGSNKYLSMALADLPTNTARPDRGAVLGEPVLPNVNDPAAVTVTDSIPCSSPVEFVVAGLRPTDPNYAEWNKMQRQLGVCIAPVAVVGWETIDWRRTSMYGTSFSLNQGKLRPRYYNRPMTLNGQTNEFLTTMQHTDDIDIETPATALHRQTLADYKYLIRQSLQQMENIKTKNVLASLGTTSGAYTRPGGWYFEQPGSSSWSSLIPDSTRNSIDAAMETLFEGTGDINDRSVGPSISCYTSVLTDAFTGLPTPTGDDLTTPSPTPTNTFTPPPTNCPGDITCTPNPTNPPSSPPPPLPNSGEARVLLSMNNAYYASGQFDTFQGAVAAVQAMCDGGSRVCAHDSSPYPPYGSGNNDPSVADHSGQLVLSRVGEDNATYPACSPSTASKDCAYQVWTNATTQPNLGGQYVRTRHFSPTPAGTTLHLGVVNPRAQLIYYRYYDPPAYEVPDGTSSYAGTWVGTTLTCPSGGSPNYVNWMCESTRYRTVDPPPRPVEDRRAWVNASVAAAPGTDTPLVRRVYGTIGGGR